jgi:1-acyl-sn-glycerol-3-phosphate acyltransferase
MLWRRVITVPGYAAAWLLWLGAAPLWIPLAVIVDAVRRSRSVALRSGALVTVYLTCEMLGIVASGLLWAWKGILRVDAERWTDIHFRLEAWWGTTLFRAVVRLFGLRIEVESDADLGRGPYLLLFRHASTGDTLLASALVSKPHGLRLRYVLKQELLWDPCLDIVGNRLPNVFVDRLSDDSAAEVRRVQELARDLGSRDGILLYPEGTRFSEAKRRRVLERFQQNGDAKMLEYAGSLAFVLPPRPGGTLGLLEAGPEADIVVCAHTGFEGAASLAQIWNGALLNRVIRVQFRRIPRDEIPTERNARIAWILQEWTRVDAWVESQQLREFSQR